MLHQTSGKIDMKIQDYVRFNKQSTDCCAAEAPFHTRTLECRDNVCPFSCYSRIPH